MIDQREPAERGEEMTLQVIYNPPPLHPYTQMHTRCSCWALPQWTVHSALAIARATNRTSVNLSLGAAPLSLSAIMRSGDEYSSVEGFTRSMAHQASSPTYLYKAA